MNHRRVGTLVALAAGALLCLAGSASAHPDLLGPWSAKTTPTTATVYEFGPGEFLGNGMWRGPYTITVGGCVTSEGDYVLRMFTGTTGTLALRDGLRLSTRVGIVDFGERAFEFMNVLYRR